MENSGPEESKENPSSPAASLHPSIESRLREKFGIELEAGVSLDEDSGELPKSTEASKSPSSGMLHRLSEHSSATTRYRIDGEIARGGMGAILEVWDEDLRRRLAMKVALSSKEGSSAAVSDLDSRVLARFLEEAQVTGQLDHPGIVPVHELGLDSEGQLYFTMRLVQGRDLEHIFQLAAKGVENWSTTRALGVLLKACEAMAYAHDKGVIHRDLKPANLMVGRFGEVYVMDWGLARVKDHEDRHDLRISEEGEAPLAVDRRQDATGESTDELYTMDGDVLGTPAYMSPEQARGELKYIDARSDVYAMGAMLYRLLTGTAPYIELGKKRSAGEILNLLLTGPPEAIESFDEAVPAELVAICDKAMARDKQERYGDMLSLSEDLRAYLENRVVSAYETGAIAETRKWVRRNKPLAFAIAAGFLALVGGLAASLVLKQQSDDNADLAETRRIDAVNNANLAETRRVEADRLAELAERRREEADQHAEDARREARVSREVNDFLNKDLLGSVSPWEKGIDVSVREVLDLAAPRLDGRFPDDPVVEAELRGSIGMSYSSLGDFSEAAKHLERSRELLLAEYGLHHRQTLVATSGLAKQWSYLDRHEEAQELASEALEVSRELLGEEDAVTIDLWGDLASTYRKQGQFRQSAEALAEICEILERRHADDPFKVFPHLNDRALAHQELGEFEIALELLTEAHETLQRVAGPKHPNMLSCKNNLAHLLEEMGRYKEAEAYHEGLLDLSREVLGPTHPRTARHLNNLGVLWMAMGRLSDAEEVLREALVIHMENDGPAHHDTIKTQNNIATCLERRGQYDATLELRLQLLDQLRENLGPSNPQTISQMNNLGVLLMQLERYEESIEMLEETTALYEELLGADHPNSLMALENLSGTYYRIRQYDRCREILSIVFEGRVEALGETHMSTIKTLSNMAMLEKSTGSKEDALVMFHDVAERFRESVGEDHYLTADAYEEIAKLYLERMELAPARDHFIKALEIRLKLDPEVPEVGYLHHQIGYCHRSLGEFAPSIESFTRAVTLRRRLHGDGHENTLTSIAGLSASLREAERFEEAEPLVIEFHETVLAQGGKRHQYWNASISSLRKLYEAWGKPEEAEAWIEGKD